MLVLILPTSKGWKAEWTSVGKKVTQIFNPRRGQGLNQGPSGLEADIWPLRQSVLIPRQNYGNVVVRVDYGKKENRARPADNLALEEFLDVYNTSDRYLVDTLPTPLWGDFSLPNCLLCGGFTNGLQVITHPPLPSFSFLFSYFFPSLRMVLFFGNCLANKFWAFACGILKCKAWFPWWPFCWDPVRSWRDHGESCQILPNLTNSQILPNLTKSCQILPNLPNSYQILPNLTNSQILPKSHQILLNLANSYQILPNLTKISPNLAKSCQFLSNLAKSYQNLNKSCHILPNLNNWNLINFCPILPHLAKSYQNEILQILSVKPNQLKISRTQCCGSAVAVRNHFFTWILWKTLTVWWVVKRIGSL